MKTIDIVLPVYNEEPGLVAFDEALFRVLYSLKSAYRFQVIYVLDRSSDNSLRVLTQLAAARNNITVLHLSRRFGHQMSLVAGMDYSSGDAIVMMDCDLQHPPELIPVLLSEFEKGFDVVHTVRTYSERTPFRRRFASSFFYRLQNMLSPLELRDGAADFRLISRKVANVFQRDIREHNQFLRGLFQWVGFSSTFVPFACSHRFAGRTKYDLPRLLAFFAAGVVSFSKVPLRMATLFGFVISCASLLYGLYLMIIFFCYGHLPPGYTSLIIVSLLLGGLQLVVLGVIGEYVGHLFDEAKSRPLYVVDEVIRGNAE